MTDEKNYKTIVSKSPKINHFVCGAIDNMAKCIGNEKNGRIIQLYSKNCSFNQFNPLVEKIDIK